MKTHSTVEVVSSCLNALRIRHPIRATNGFANLLHPSCSNERPGTADLTMHTLFIVRDGTRKQSIEVTLIRALLCRGMPPKFAGSTPHFLNYPLIVICWLAAST